MNTMPAEMASLQSETRAAAFADLRKVVIVC